MVRNPQVRRRFGSHGNPAQPINGPVRGGKDPLFASVIFLTHFNTLNAGQDVPVVGASMTYLNSASQSSAQTKFNPWAAFINGSTTGRVGGANQTAITTSPFAVEGWFYTTTTGVDQAFFAIGSQDTDDANRMQCGVSPDGSMYYYAGGAMRCTSAAGLLVASQWNFFQLISSGVGAACAIGLNGSQIASGTDSASHANGNLWLGGNNFPNSANVHVRGYIDEWRVTRASGRTFNLPTKAFPDHA